MLENVAEEARVLGGAVVGALSTIFVVMFRSRTDIQRAAMQERAEFTAHVMEQLQAAEQMRMQERSNLLAKIDRLKEEHNAQIINLNRIIEKQGERITHLEALVPYRESND